MNIWDTLKDTSDKWYSWIIIDDEDDLWYKNTIFLLYVTKQISSSWGLGIILMVFNATFNNISAISWQSVLLVEETGVPGEKSLTT